jgi:hypothetical protein
MNESTSSRKRWTGRVKATAAIWVLFLAVLSCVGFAAAASASTTSTTAPTTTSSIISNPVTSTTSLSTILGTTSTAGPTDPTAISCSPFGASTTSCQTMYKADPTGLLPAYRWWSSAILLNTAPGDDPGNAVFMEVFDFLGSIIFGLAGLLWFLLLEIIKYALDLSLISAAGATINQGFAWLSANLTASGVLFLVLLVAFVIAFRIFLRGGLGKLISLLLIVVIPIATMWTLADIINSNPSGSGNATPVGTPAWLAVQGTSIIDQVAGTIATGFGTLIPSQQVSADTSLNCAAYTDALYGEYNTYSNQSDLPPDAGDAPDASAQSSSSDQPVLNQAGTVALAAASEIWQQAYLNDWVSAQYGSSTQGQDTYCRQLEYSSNISPFEQAALTEVAAEYSATGGGTSTPPISANVFYLPPNVNAQTVTASIFAFAACTYDSSSGQFTSSANDWEYFDSAGVQNANEACEDFFANNSALNQGSSPSTASGGEGILGHLGNLFNDACSFAVHNVLDSCTAADGLGHLSNDVVNVAAKIVAPGSTSCANSSLTCNGTIAYLYNLNTTSAISTAYNQALTSSGSSSTSVSQAQLGQDYHSMTSYWGQNETWALLDALLALVCAVIYLYALGALAFGTILAQIGLVIMLLLLPATLLLLAVPTKEGKRIRSGTTLLRTTLGFIVSKGILTVVLVVMLEMILWIQQLLNVGTGPLSGLVNAVIPLAVLYLMKKILSALGMPNLTSLQGALSMPTAAAMALSGSASATSSVMGGLNRALGSDEIRDKNGNLIKRARGLNRLDQSAKMPLKRAKRGALEKWSGEPGNEAHPGLKKSVAGFLGLDQLRTQVFGRRDANTDRITTPGYLAKPYRLAGLMEAARAGRLTKGAGTALALDPANPNFDPNTSDPLRGFGSRAFDATDLELDQRKKIMAATRFKTRSERLRIMSEMALEDGEHHITERHALRNSKGEIITDQAGNAVFAWRRTLENPLVHDGAPITIDPATKRITRGGTGQPVYELLGRSPDGVVRKVSFADYVAMQEQDPASVQARTVAHTELLDEKTAESLTPEERGRLAPVLTFQERYTPEEQFVSNTRYMDGLSLRDGQAALSMIGYDGIVAPLLANADGRGRLVTTKTPDGDAKVAMYAVNYLPNEVKQRPKGMTDDEYCIYLHNVNRYVGGEDPQGNIVDIPARFGIDVYSAAGQAEIEAEHAGLPSAFDRIKFVVPPEVQRAAIADAKSQMRGTEGLALRQNVEIVWGEASEGYVREAQAKASALSTNAAKLDALRLEIRGAAMDVGTTRIKRNNAREAVAALPELTAQVEQMTAQLGAARQNSAAPEEIEELSKALEAYDKQLKAARNDEATLPELEARLTEVTDKARRLARDVTSTSEDSVALNATTTELAETMEYMFEMRQAASGRKGRKGTSDLSALIDMKDVAGKVRMGNDTALQSQVDTISASLTKLLASPDFDTTQLETLLTDATKHGTEISRASRHKVQEAIGLQNALIAKMDKVNEELGREPRRPDWRT